MFASTDQLPTGSAGQKSPITEVPAADGDGGWGRAVFWPRGARWRGIIWLSAIFGAYVGAVVLYPYLESDGVALLWLPNAVLATALIRFRPRDWPYVYAAGLAAEVVGDLTFDVAPHQALYFGAVNAVEATLFVLCAVFIASSRSSIGLLSVRSALAVVLASVTVPALTGSLGAIGSVWTFDADYVTAWRTWWFGDSLGLMVGVPIGLLLRDAVRSVALRRSGRLALGGGGPAALVWLASATLAVNGNAWGAQQTGLAAAVLLALTFGAVGAPVAAVLTTTVTLIGLAQDEGFASVVMDQTLLFVVFAAIYTIAATAESADQAMGQLRRARNDLEIANERLASLSRTDELTGMSNRRALSENLELLWAWCVRESKPVAMLMADIDCFHQYNATYGHICGDSAIRRIATVIKGSARRRTDLVVRYGGEEFLVVLPNAELDHAKNIADRIHEQVRDLNIEHASSPVAPFVTVSIGVLAVAEPTPTSAITALESCDRLMYQAKAAGRNRTVTAQQ